MQNRVQSRPLASASSRGQGRSGEKQGQRLLIAGGLILGTVGVFAEEANQPALVTVWFRCVFGALALLVWGLATGRVAELRIRGRSWWIVLAAGGFMVLNWALFFAAIPLTSIGVATIVFHIQPVWLIFYSAVVLHEAVPRRQQVATAVALGGLVLTTGLWSGSVNDIKSGHDYVVGLLLCLGGSLSYAAVTILAKREKVVTSFAMAWWQCAVGILVLAWTPITYGWPTQVSSWAWLAGLGVLHTGLAYAILFAGMTCMTLGRVAVLQYVYPLTAVLLDWVVYGRTLDAVQLTGVGLMGIALVAIKSR
ncbi:DMT family transporter [Ottowia thiooxydans]|uniref:DMT family transporter n=1 Tax=Ottowia thiooxydans TaxID=219182 RepID=UPI00048F4C7D|nr:DMT family transporter [Ottowia thiooxydans]